MRLVYGYDYGSFTISITDEDDPSPRVLQRITLTRKEAALIGVQIKFGRTGQTKTIADHKEHGLIYNNQIVSKDELLKLTDGKGI